MSKTVTISKWVDVGLDEIETDDLIEELKFRKAEILDSDPDDLTEMFYAFKLEKIDRAIELAKKIACDHTGLIL